MGSVVQWAAVVPVIVALSGCGPRLPAEWEQTDAGEATHASADTTEDEEDEDGDTTGGPAPLEVVELAAGDSHVCGLWAELGVHCWGGGWLGQIGDGGLDDAATPQPVAELGLDVVRIGAGNYHGCAALESGAAACWGHNVDGSLGDGSDEDSPRPVMVEGLTGPALAVSGGAAALHTCARLEVGTMMCWGRNTSGELGDGSLMSAATAQPVVGLDRVVDFAIGYVHTCALVDDGHVYCWGWNPHGLVDAGAPSEAVFDTPQQKLGLAGIVDIAAGNHHACALHEDGAVSCWGYEGQGQLGDGSEQGHPNPRPVAELDDAVAIAGGTNHNCALRAGGSIVCWGANHAGQLGDGTTTARSTPVEVAGLDDATQVAVASNFSCALSRTRGPVCWGVNSQGQLGDGSFVDSPTPVVVAPP